MDRQSIPVAVAGFHWIIYRRHFMLCFGVLILIGSFHICRGVRRLPASLSGRRSFVVKMPRPHGNCKFRNEWLAIDKFKDWVARDRADDKSQGGEMTKCTLWLFYVCMKTVRIARAGKHAMARESHVWSAQHQICERAASSSVVNVLAPQSRVTVPSTALTSDLSPTSDDV